MKIPRLVASALSLALVMGAAQAQMPYPPPGYPPPGAAMVYAPPQLDQMLAALALYPDPLLTEILTAATYPYEIDAAARWLQVPPNASLTDGPLFATLQTIDWDPSVKSLLPFPQILMMLDQHLDWTQAIGNAFLAQPADVMDSIQRLRQEALAAGSLVSSPYVNVVQDGPYIEILPASPQLVYVPIYDPRALFRAWPYPGYPPFYYGPPPGLGARGAVAGIGFSIGIGIVDALWNWGDWDWRDHDVRVDPQRFNRINAGHPPIAAPTWQHDPAHRQGVPYVDPKSRAAYQAPVPGSADQRRQYRFYQPQTTSPAPAQERAAPPQQERAAPPQQGRAAPPQQERAAPPQQGRAAPPQLERPAQPQERPALQQERAAAPPPQARAQPQMPVVTSGPRAVSGPPPTAFQGFNRGAAPQAEAQRGQQSRQAPVMPSTAPARAAPAAAPRPQAPQAQRPPQQRQAPQQQQRPGNPRQQER